MSEAGVRGLELTVSDVRTLIEQLTPEDWDRPSAAEGWTVKDAIWHMADLQVLLTSALTGASSDAPVAGIEKLNEIRLAEHKQDSPEQVTAYFESASHAAAPVFEQLQEPAMAAVSAPFLDLGTYSVALMPDVCAFDFVAHLRYDVLAPRGPLAAQVPPLDDVRAVPAVRWLIAGIEQMQPDLAAHVRTPFELRLDGPGGGRWVVEPDGGDLHVSVLGGGAEPPDCIESSTGTFFAWATRRMPWRRSARVIGDPSLSRWLDALNLI